MTRLEPQGSPEQYVSHAWKAPAKTHWRIVSCEQADCEAWRNGWATTVDVSTDLGARQAKYIFEKSGRAFRTDSLDPGETIMRFHFPAGQQCFREHKEQFRPGLYVVRDGDWRGNPTGRVHQVSEQTWTDDLGEQTERLAEIRKRG